MKRRRERARACREIGPSSSVPRSGKRLCVPTSYKYSIAHSLRVQPRVRIHYTPSPSTRWVYSTPCVRVYNIIICAHRALDDVVSLLPRIPDGVYDCASARASACASGADGGTLRSDEHKHRNPQAQEESCCLHPLSATLSRVRASRAGSRAGSRGLKGELI